MLINPYQVNVATVPGTRMLQESFGLTGFEIEDPATHNRTWTIHNLYAPITGRTLGGIRAKLVDAKGFVTFCNQRDLEILLEIAKPGQWCTWANSEYPGLNDIGWYGLCMDTEDLFDDLYERELMLLAQHQHEQLNPSTIEITRRIHTDKKSDWEDLWILNSGMGIPCNGRESLRNRWIRVSKDHVDWKTL